MNSSVLAWLTSEDGKDLLEKARSLPPDRLTRVTRLRKKVPTELASAIVELIELRARGSAKFGRASEMLLTPIGLEQSTGERIAKYRASRFPRAVPLLDACCGIGGDAMQFAAQQPVLAVDRDHVSCVCTSHNCSLGEEPAYPVRTACMDVTELKLTRLQDAGFRSAFLDPGRRHVDSGGTVRRIRNPEEYSPPLSWLKRLSEVFPFVCAKVSPLIDDHVLVNYRCGVEFISDRGECKEALLWLGDFEDWQPNPHHSGYEFSGYSASVIDAVGASATLKPIACPTPAVGDPATWIFEPDGAVVRAHLTPVLASYIPARLLDSSSYYLTSDSDVRTPFATRYRMLDMAPLRPADIQKRCIALGREVTAVKTRWMPHSPDELIKRVPGAGKGAPPAVIIVVRIHERHMALICEPGSGTDG